MPQFKLNPLATILVETSLHSTFYTIKALQKKGLIVFLLRKMYTVNIYSS